MRDWKPLPTAKLALIIRDSERDNPVGEWTPDDVYRLAREVECRRKAARIKRQIGEQRAQGG